MGRSVDICHGLDQSLNSSHSLHYWTGRTFHSDHSPQADACHRPFAHGALATCIRGANNPAPLTVSSPLALSYWITLYGKPWMDIRKMSFRDGRISDPGLYSAAMTAPSSGGRFFRFFRIVRNLLR